MESDLKTFLSCNLFCTNFIVSGNSDIGLNELDESESVSTRENVFMESDPKTSLLCRLLKMCYVYSARPVAILLIKNGGLFSSDFGPF